MNLNEISQNFEQKRFENVSISTFLLYNKYLG